MKAGRVVDRWSGIASDNLARQVTLHPTRPKAYLPHIRSAVERAHGEGSIFPYVTILDTAAGEGKLMAVHTRVEYSPTVIPGFTSRPEMYLGTCTIAS